MSSKKPVAGIPRAIAVAVIWYESCVCMAARVAGLLVAVAAGLFNITLMIGVELAVGSAGRGVFVSEGMGEEVKVAVA